MPHAAGGEGGEGGHVFCAAKLAEYPCGIKHAHPGHIAAEHQTCRQRGRRALDHRMPHECPLTAPTAAIEVCMRFHRTRSYGSYR